MLIGRQLSRTADQTHWTFMSCPSMEIPSEGCFKSFMSHHTCSCYQQRTFTWLPLTDCTLGNTHWWILGPGIQEQFQGKNIPGLHWPCWFSNITDPVKIIHRPYGPWTVWMVIPQIVLLKDKVGGSWVTQFVDILRKHSWKHVCTRLFAF